jgi:iron(III) transport system ATP-binding protein
VLLLDEPLSNLDAQLRERMRGEIRAVQQKLGITAVYVTHDQNEALAISDLILVMDGGHLVETGAPEQIYRRPRAEFTANFIGVANAFDGAVLSSNATELVLTTPQGVLRAEPAPELRAGDTVRAFVRPENFGLTRKRHSEEDWTGTVRYGIYQGDCWDYTVDVANADVRVRVHREKVGLGHGDVVHLSPDGSEVVVMPMRDGTVSTRPYTSSPVVAPARGHVTA